MPPQVGVRTYALEGDFRRGRFVGVDRDPVADFPRHPLQHPARGRDVLRLLADLRLAPDGADHQRSRRPPITTTPIAEATSSSIRVKPSSRPRLQTPRQRAPHRDHLEARFTGRGPADADRVDGLDLEDVAAEGQRAAASAASRSRASAAGRPCRRSRCPAVRSRRRSGRPAAACGSSSRGRR